MTDWNLDCSVSAYKTVLVQFSDESSPFVGPPEEQKEEFIVFEATELTQTILDSVQKTIQMNLTDEGGDPDALEVYYSTMNDESLEFSNIEMYVPMEEPYTGLVSK